MPTSSFPTQEKINTFRYLITKFNESGWADAEKSLPIPFDLVTVLTDTHKQMAAWWNKNEWEGVRLKKTDKVMKWRRRIYEHIT